MQLVESKIMFIWLPPRHPACRWRNFIGQVKGSSSHLASRLIDGVVEPFEWQAEYGVLTISESHLSKVVHYALNQKQHHAENTLDDRLERIE